MINVLAKYDADKIRIQMILDIQFTLRLHICGVYHLGFSTSFIHSNRFGEGHCSTTTWHAK